jgi:hypothetical protein
LLWLTTISFALQVAGRQNVFPVPRGLWLYPDEQGGGGCTTVALLYPSWNLEGLENYMMEPHAATFTKDCIMDNYYRLNNLPRYTIVPSLCQHIGFHSSSTLRIRKYWNQMLAVSHFDTSEMV